jgi:hypothetical protein
MLRAPAGVCETCDLIRVAGTAEQDTFRPRVFMRLAHHPDPVQHLAPMKPPEENASGGNGADAPPVTRPCGKYRKGEERGICGNCGATRAEDMAAKKISGAPAARRKREPGPAADDPLMRLEQLRSTYTEEHERCTREAAAWLAKLEVLDEVENAMRA